MTYWTRAISHNLCKIILLFFLGLNVYGYSLGFPLLKRANLKHLSEVKLRESPLLCITFSLEKNEDSLKFVNFFASKVSLIVLHIMTLLKVVD